MVKIIVVKQIGFLICCFVDQCVILIGLGLNKMNKICELEDIFLVCGMINKILYMVKIIEEKD